MNWKDAELLAKTFLENKGYSPLLHNIKIKIPSLNTNVQIDLLYESIDHIIAFEVKLHSYDINKFFPLKYNQYKRITKAINYHFPNKFLQVDLVIINNQNIQHIPNIQF